jgi:hypothetical protein
VNFSVHTRFLAVFIADERHSYLVACTLRNTENAIISPYKSRVPISL